MCLCVFAYEMKQQFYQMKRVRAFPYVFTFCMLLRIGLPYLYVYVYVSLINGHEHSPTWILYVKFD